MAGYPGSTLRLFVTGESHQPFRKKDVYGVAMSESHIDGDQPCIVLSSTRGVGKTYDFSRVGEIIALSSTKYRVLTGERNQDSAGTNPPCQRRLRVSSYPF